MQTLGSEKLCDLKETGNVFNGQGMLLFFIADHGSGTSCAEAGVNLKWQRRWKHWE